jgi:hemolysin III
MYMLNSFGITLLSVLWGLTVLGIIYTFFFRKVEVFNANLHRMGCIMVVGGRTFFESIPSNILTMNWGITLPYRCYFLFMEEISVQPLSGYLFVLAAAVCHYVAILLAVASK